MQGIEWIVEAQGCRAADLRSLAALQELFAAIIRDLDLHVVGEMRWHQFPGSNGVTGFALLSESHLAVHTFPEHQSLCLNLFCCRPRPNWDFVGELQVRLGADRVNVRRVERPYVADADDVLRAMPVGEAVQ
ncbi:putative S-adenosylmethionine decarboxylase proenzyme [Candidatus Koribacter versatilis Ellin345]|uniref:S-adenosylmethionine decarboxylase proenzyme n=1 Tax=Koribacter versatilis (strain Ellin345) TaxID=204669 RepID=Q1IVI9_KORVE|nr:S-adenosylmethionine decarboxylase [Candidatus Koribacter versatilis]ABF39111.1 putative S-adenosylmethionine decarboxylase proenzyme [Candidatus Koribacter versatilis Ellin345]